MFTSDTLTEERPPGFQSRGVHFLVNYHGCDLERLNDAKSLVEALRSAAKQAGATVIRESVHIFEKQGMTAMLLLSESHATIHTYPEHGGCFVDFFTCGESCDQTVFDRVMRAYLLPRSVDSQSIERSLQE